MASQPCEACLEQPVMQCGRCTRTRCAAHQLAPGERCPGCELDWQDEAPTRRNAKLLLAPPVAVLAGGVVFGLLLPVTIGGMLGATLMAALISGTAVTAGAGACRIVERTARAQFLREHAGALPSARLLPSPKRG